ncbi:MAG: GTP-binding protein [Lachnospiraceae bacterium]|nr:GTP-binding protein [Lachnospiraceae bacterium]
MAIEAYVISGFLGAGKTTLIQRMIKEVFQDRKIAIIENDFGETSMDAAILRSKSVQVRELSSGCICCSLSGNFVEAMYQVIRDYLPDCILIEPSGVGKLSDVIRACNHPKIMSLLNRIKAITVVDVTTLQKYCKNYGEFFIDQLRYADTIWLSHMEKSNLMISQIQGIISGYTRASIVAADKKGSIPEGILKESIRMSIWQERGKMPGESRPKVKSGFGFRTNNGIRHTAKEVFDTCSIYSQAEFEKKQIKDMFSLLEEGEYGDIIRAKGIIKGKDGYVCVQYVPGKLTLEDVLTKGNSLSFIGHNLKKQNLNLLFDGGSGQ